MMVPQSESWFCFLCPVASRIPNHFGDSWPIPPLGIKREQSHIFEFYEMLQACLGMEYVTTFSIRSRGMVL